MSTDKYGPLLKNSLFFPDGNIMQLNYTILYPAFLRPLDLATPSGRRPICDLARPATKYHCSFIYLSSRRIQVQKINIKNLIHIQLLENMFLWWLTMPGTQ